MSVFNTLKEPFHLFFYPFNYPFSVMHILVVVARNTDVFAIMCVCKKEAKWKSGTNSFNVIVDCPKISVGIQIIQVTLCVPTKETCLDTHHRVTVY